MIISHLNEIKAFACVIRSFQIDINDLSIYYCIWRRLEINFFNGKKIFIEKKDQFLSNLNIIIANNAFVVLARIIRT